ncbi:MAG: LamG-like jellyroll fold domain-containing protein, partial [Candidatus Micrarchaeaceae archaeon]
MKQKLEKGAINVNKSHGVQKAQIALEYMIVFSFVMIIFAFLFGVIAVQRAQVMTTQLFQQEQLLAQDIASQISQALQAGSGYSSSAPTPAQIGTTPVQIYVTKNGEVLVNASIGKQVVQAVAYTPAHIVSSPSYQQANKYLLPSSGTINITNAYGTICIDYNCTAPSNIASKISMSSQVVHAAQFNGVSSYISAPASSSTESAITVTFWIYPVPSQYWGISGNYWENAISGGGGCWNNYFFYIESGSNPPTESWSITNTSGTTYRLFPGKYLSPNTWQQLVGVYNGT